MSKPIEISVAAGQMRVVPADLEGNFQRMLNQIDQAREQHADIVAFPELSLSGYQLGDLWYNQNFLQELQERSCQVRENSEGICVVHGNVLPDFRQSLVEPDRSSFGNDGKSLRYNAAFADKDREPLPLVQPHPQFLGQEILPEQGVTIKTNTPLYNQFEDQRYFLPYKELAQQLGIPLERLLQPFRLQLKEAEIKLGVLICEDIWVGDYAYNGKILNPAQILADNGADFLVALSASPYYTGKNAARIRVMNNLQYRLAQTGEPKAIFSINCVGTQDNGKHDHLFDGRSSFTSADGTVRQESPALVEDLTVYKTELNSEGKKEFLPQPEVKQSKVEKRTEIHRALVQEIQEFVEKSHVQKVVIGLSGGIDSALVAALFVEAIGADKILAVNMPSQFNSDWTKDVARKIAANLEIDYQVVPIEEIANAVRSSLKGVTHHGDGGNYTEEHQERLTDENLQAKIRTPDILSNIAGKYPGAIYTSNGNKSEIALGYFTLDGDGRGAVVPIGDLFKTEVIDLSVQMNEEWLQTHEEPLFPWELLTSEFLPRRYYEEWDGETMPYPKGTRKLVPSAELSKAQNVDEGKGDPIIFPYHDEVLRRFIEEEEGPESILEAYTEGGLEGLATLLNIHPIDLKELLTDNFATPQAWMDDLSQVIWKKYQNVIYKQVQSPPILVVSKRAFGFDYRRARSLFPWLAKKFTQMQKALETHTKWDFS